MTAPQEPVGGVETLPAPTALRPGGEGGQPPRQQNFGGIDCAYVAPANPDPLTAVRGRVCSVEAEVGDLRDQLRIAKSNIDFLGERVSDLEDDAGSLRAASKLRAAAAEALLAVGLVIGEVQNSSRISNYTSLPAGLDRLLKAMEQLREALS